MRFAMEHAEFNYDVQIYIQLTLKYTKYKFTNLKIQLT